MKMLYAIHGCLAHDLYHYWGSILDRCLVELDQPALSHASNMASIISPAPHRQDILSHSSIDLPTSGYGRCYTATNARLRPAWYRIWFGLSFIICLYPSSLYLFDSEDAPPVQTLHSTVFMMDPPDVRIITVNFCLVSALDQLGVWNMS